MLTRAPAEPAEPGFTPVKRRPWWSRISAAHLFIVVAGILAFVTNLAILRGPDEPTTVAVASVDLEPGRVLDPDRVELVEIDASPELLATLVTGDQLATLEEAVLTEPVAAGELIPRRALRPASGEAAGLRAVSIPVDRQHAVGGAIERGDRVDVIAVTDGVARYILTGVEVSAVPTSERSSLAGSGSFFVVVLVDDEQALRIVHALRTGSIDVVRSTGAPAPQRLELEQPSSQDDEEPGGA